MNGSTSTEERMGHQGLPSKLWAKAEIVLGYNAAIIGSLSSLYYVVRMAVHGESNLIQAGLGATAAVLGMYLTSAGNRSMLYRSQNEQTRYIEKLLDEKIKK